MELYSFRVILADPERVLDDPATDGFMRMCDAVFEAGCDDSSPGVCNGVVFVDFDREAESLRDAIESAVRDVERAGYRVTRVEPDDITVYEEVNQQLAARAPATSSSTHG